MNPRRVALGADVHEALGLRPQVQTSSKRFYTVSYVTCVQVGSSRLGCCEGTLPACGCNRNPYQLVGSQHPSHARCLVGTLPGLWAMGTLLELSVETNLVPKLWYLTLIL